VREVAVIGVGTSQFGKRSDVQLVELAWESIREALKDSGVSQKDVDFVVTGNLGMWSSEPLPAVVISEYAGLNPTGTMKVEAACATGSAAVMVAYSAIQAGLADIAMAVGVEKMNESPLHNVVEFIGRAGNYFWEFQNFGLTFPAYYALHAVSYMAKFGITEEDLGLVAVKNHYYGSKNPKAQFQKPISIEEVLKSPYVAYPLKLYDCSPVTDGSSCVILASEDVVREYTDTPVWIRGIGTASDTANLSKRKEFWGLKAARVAAEQAYKMAGVHEPLGFFDVAEVHDCFTIAEIMAYEDLGFAKQGEGVELLKEEQTYIGGKIPVNLDGGLKAKGHPIGATGISMIAELTKQLQQRVEKDRQTDIINGNALAHNVGGTGHYAYVTVLSLNRR
jgi:acetyl-CoA C-acetyltransferase